MPPQVDEKVESRVHVIIGVPELDVEADKEGVEEPGEEARDNCDKEEVGQEPKEQGERQHRAWREETCVNNKNCFIAAGKQEIRAFSPKIPS